MKRLITSLIVSLMFVFAQVGSVVADTQRFWKLDMFDPAASTTSRTINIEYKVFSTISDDTFSVQLFENEVLKETQNINHVYGNSSKFSVSIPSTGTYTYKITATNSDDVTPQSKSKQVQVVDGPSPTVTTVFVTNTPAGGAGGGAGGGAAQAAGAAGGAVAAPAGGAGQVGDAPATTTQDVLGAETKAADAAKLSADKTRRNQYLGAGIALIAVAAAYYFFRMRQANED